MIPKFDQNGVLPPYIGSTPTVKASRAPYRVGPREVVERFAFSSERRKILHGFFEYRRALRNYGISNGFQWVNGSFIEDCESVRQRPPNDIDLVTLVLRPNGYQDNQQWHAHVDTNAELRDLLLNPEYIKSSFRCDAYVIDLGADARQVALSSAYWYGLFSHQRGTSLWKGLLQVDLLADDGEAISLLQGGEQNAPQA